MIETIVDRIAYISKLEGITIFQMERCINASKGTLYKAIQGKKDIQAKWLTAIATLYPQYSSRWLLTGEPPILEASDHASGLEVKEINGAGNLVANGHGASISLPRDQRDGIWEKEIALKNEQIKDLTHALKDAHAVILALSARK